jgi:hypothetical protein
MIMCLFRGDAVIKYAVTLILALSSYAEAAHAATLKYEDLVGTWKVAAVVVNSDGMQALMDDDPQFMGAVVEFSPDKIVWLKGTTLRPIDPETDNCHMPLSLTSAGADNPDTLLRIDGGFNIFCGDRGWGPGAVAVPIDSSTVALYWYENGILTLKREK